jgi:hypothetical protein
MAGGVVVRRETIRRLFERLRQIDQKGHQFWPLTVRPRARGAAFPTGEGIAGTDYRGSNREFDRRDARELLAEIELGMTTFSDLAVEYYAVLVKAVGFLRPLAA